MSHLCVTSYDRCTNKRKGKIIDRSSEFARGPFFKLEDHGLILKLLLTTILIEILTLLTDLVMMVMMVMIIQKNLTLLLRIRCRTRRQRIRIIRLRNSIFRVTLRNRITAKGGRSTVTLYTRSHNVVNRRRQKDVSSRMVMNLRDRIRRFNRNLQIRRRKDIQ